MYISDNIYDRVCTYVDLPDREFFMCAIEEAIRLTGEVGASGIDTDTLKQRVPIAHISKLSKQTRNETEIDRRTAHGDRARRGFLMGDVDFNADQKRESMALYNKLRRLANSLDTPLLLYPTLSAPAKPRYRFVFLTKRAVNAAQYYQAMSWLYEQVGCEGMDEGDKSMRVNRNLPLFLDDAYKKMLSHSTFDRDDLEPLDNALWRDMPKPAKRAPIAAGDVEMHAIRLDPALCVEAAEKCAEDGIVGTYNKTWPLINAIAASVASGALARDTAYEICDALAGAAEDEQTKARWRSGNRTMLDGAIGRMGNAAEVNRTRPLVEWGAFMEAAIV